MIIFFNIPDLEELSILELGKSWNGIITISSFRNFLQIIYTFGNCSGIGNVIHFHFICINLIQILLLTLITKSSTHGKCHIIYNVIQITNKLQILSCIRLIEFLC